MKTNPEIALESLRLALDLLKELATEDFKEEKLHELLMELAKAKELKNGQLLWPLRVALTGQEQSPGGAIELLDIFGQEESLRRIEIGIDKLVREL